MDKFPRENRKKKNGKKNSPPPDDQARNGIQEDLECPETNVRLRVRRLAGCPVPGTESRQSGAGRLGLDTV